MSGNRERNSNGLLRSRHAAAWGIVAALFACFAILHAADGDLDLTFGVDGKVIINVGTNFTLGDGVQAVAVDANGRIVAAGFYFPWLDESELPGETLALARFNPDGSLDTSFGTGGVVKGGPVPSVVAIDRNGEIIVVGTWISRYHENGALDTSFGNGGSAGPACGVYAAIVIDTVGRIVVAGTSQTSTSVLCVA